MVALIFGSAFDSGDKTCHGGLYMVRGDIVAWGYNLEEAAMVVCLLCLSRIYFHGSVQWY